MLKNIKSQKGQGMVEYLIIVAIVAVGAMTTIRHLSHTTNGKFSQITTSLQGGAAGQVRFEKLKPEHYKKKDMSNFFRGSRSNR